MPSKKPRLSPEEALSKIAAKYQGHEKLRGIIDSIIEEIRDAAGNCSGGYMALAKKADLIFGQTQVAAHFSELGLNSEEFENKILDIFRR